MIVYDARQKPVELGEVVGRGGEATVYHVARQPDRLAKIYEPEPRPNYTGKLEWMVNHPPENPTQHLNHASLAWPGGLLFDSRRRLKGYWMPYIQDTVPLLEVFNPRRRAEKLPQFNRRYLLRTARNLAAALSALQRSGYVAGDLNESNVLVTPAAMVTLIDTDSFQVREERGEQPIIHACPVGKPEYTPPELQHKALAEVVRRPDQDAFGLAVLIFQLLMDGSHPFRAQWLAAGDPPPLEIRIANGAYPYIEQPAYPVRPPKNTLGIHTLHPSLQELFRRCFIEGHRDPRWRPGPDLWVRALTDAERVQVLCSEGHFYSSHLETCPYCALAQQRRQAPAQAPRPAPAKEKAPTGRARSRWTAPPFAQPHAAPAGAAAPAQAAPASRGRPVQTGLGGASYRPAHPIFSRFSSWLGSAPAPAGAPAGSVGGFAFPRSGSVGVLRSRPVLTRADVLRWMRAWAYKSLTIGGRQGALAGGLLGSLVALVNWSMGEPLYWSILFAASGTLGGLLRGWKPGHKLASVIDRFVGWKLFWEAIGFMGGTALGGLLGLAFIWAVIPVILGLVLGAQLGILTGRKLWEVGRLLGWERIWGTFSALNFGLLGYGIARLAGLVGMNDLGQNLVTGLLPFAANGELMWAGIWVMAGGAGGALAGALSGLATDLLGRFFRLVD